MGKEKLQAKLARRSDARQKKGFALLMLGFFDFASCKFKERAVLDSAGAGGLAVAAADAGVDVVG
jgi:hypothetical protein